MVNKLRGGVAIPGTDLVLRLDVNAICEIEAEFDTDMSSIDQVIGDSPRMTDIRRLYWAVLRSQKPGITVQEVGEAMSAAGIDRAGDLFREAAEAAGLGAAEKDEPGKNQ